MSDDLVHRLRTEWINDDSTLCELAADRIEALERACWKMHEADNKEMAALESRIQALEAALREIAELYRDPAGRGAEIARRALEGKP